MANYTPALAGLSETSSDGDHFYEVNNSTVRRRLSDSETVTNNSVDNEEEKHPEAVETDIPQTEDCEPATVISDAEVDAECNETGPYGEPVCNTYRSDNSGQDAEVDGEPGGQDHEQRRGAPGGQDPGQRRGAPGGQDPGQRRGAPGGQDPGQRRGAPGDQYPEQRHGAQGNQDPVQRRGAPGGQNPGQPHGAPEPGPPPGSPIYRGRPRRHLAGRYRNRRISVPAPATFFPPNHDMARNARRKPKFKQNKR